MARSYGMFCNKQAKAHGTAIKVAFAPPATNFGIRAIFIG